MDIQLQRIVYEIAARNSEYFENMMSFMLTLTIYIKYPCCLKPSNNEILSLIF